MKENKKVWYIVVALLIMVFLLVGYICFDKFISNKNEKNDEVVDKNNKDDIVEGESKYSGNFILRDENVIYYADANDMIKTGNKKEIIYDAHELAEIKIYDNKVYYFNDKDKLCIYDLKTNKNSIYNFNNVEVNALTVILPGYDYTIVSDVDNFVKIDMKTKETSKIDIHTDNYFMVFDSKENILYYVDGDETGRFDVKNNKKLDNFKSGFPLFINDKYVYLYHENENVGYLDICEKNGKIVSSIKIVIGDITLLKYIENNDDFYLFSNFTLRKIDSNNKDTIIYENSFDEIVDTNIGIFIKEYETIDGYDEVIAGELYKIYEYNYTTGRIKEINNQYISDLFEYQTYYINN